MLTEDYAVLPEPLDLLERLVSLELPDSLDNLGLTERSSRSLDLLDPLECLVCSKKL